jgi:hypothetical protein
MKLKITLTLLITTSLFACNDSSKTKVDLSVSQIKTEIKNHPCYSVHKSQCTTESFQNLTSLKKMVAKLALKDK